MSSEVEQLAQNVARNLGWPVFPCGWNSKTPTRPKSEGGNGFKDATVNPDEIKWLWRRWPGGLIGIDTDQAKVRGRERLQGCHGQIPTKSNGSGADGLAA